MAMVRYTARSDGSSTDRTLNWAGGRSLTSQELEGRTVSHGNCDDLRGRKIRRRAAGQQDRRDEWRHRAAGAVEDRECEQRVVRIISVAWVSCSQVQPAVLKSTPAKLLT